MKIGVLDFVNNQAPLPIGSTKATVESDFQMTLGLLLTESENISPAFETKGKPNPDDVGPINKGGQMSVADVDKPPLLEIDHREETLSQNPKWHEVIKKLVHTVSKTVENTPVDESINKMPTRQEKISSVDFSTEIAPLIQILDEMNEKVAESIDADLVVPLIMVGKEMLSLPHFQETSKVEMEEVEKLDKELQHLLDEFDTKGKETFPSQLIKMDSSDSKVNPEKQFSVLQHIPRNIQMEKAGNYSVEPETLQTEFKVDSLQPSIMQTETDSNRLEKLNHFRLVRPETIIDLVGTGKSQLPHLNEDELSGEKKLSQLENALRNLLDQLQNNGEETKHQHLGNAIKLAFSQSKEKLEKIPTMNQFSVFQHIPRRVQLDSVQITMIPSESETVSQVNVNHTPHMRTETFDLNLLDQMKQEPTMRGFMQEFSNILGRSNLTTSMNTTKLLIKLYPEALGMLRIELLQKDGLMTARLMASTSMAKEILDSQLHSLKHAFITQNIQVDKIEVTNSQSEAQKYTSQDGHREEQNKDEHQRKENLHALQKDDSSFKEALSNILFETEV
ncbi:flagellar hook-length control protein FliK [Lederbergia citrea]|uniref:Flagellar hook-length control protein FliK n=1 Tax=Lederbergia citrea TaxID=2833581 RepID=A0A942UMT3_9BACI|nr:flagellar hook-length control protein FliK [Lederbergia citrea]MBS4177119.1 flagellar hook-length control protein FliK [Lederbergia citrea]MBS4221633.1 flagellar hook-length control protein FliK [Lederbergia citrea]